MKPRPGRNFNASELTLISHALCPYVQRAVIALTEKRIAFVRRDIDLAQKPDWFNAISPLGRTPVLLVGDTAIFESAVILEYLEETQANPLHPAEPLRRAEHRAWIEFASTLLADIAGFYSAPDAATFEAKRRQLADRFARLAARRPGAPWFDGDDFSLVDAAFAPVFRYFDTFDTIEDFAILPPAKSLWSWRRRLAMRPSVKAAVRADYRELLCAFLARRQSHLGRRLRQADGARARYPVAPAAPPAI